jgi:heat shock protein HslJ
VNSGAAPSAAELVGAWRVIGIGADPVPAGAVIELHEDGRITGSTGINRLTGAFALIDGELRTSPLATTRMAGSPELMDVERRLLAALADPVPVRRDGDRLMLGSGEHMLILRLDTP